MCIPTIAAMGLTLAGSAAQYAQQSANVRAQQSFQNKMAARNRELANASTVVQYEALSRRVQEEQLKAGAAASRVAQDALAARARVTAAAAEAGVGGASLEALLSDFTRQEGEFIANTELNLEFAQTQAELEKTAIRYGLEGRLLASAPDQLAPPNLFASALSAFTNTFMTGLSIDTSMRNAGAPSAERLFI